MAREFDSASWAAKITRTSERKSLDSIDVDRTAAVCKEIHALVGPWAVYERCTMKIARAIVERKVSPVRVGEVIETIIVRRREQRLRNLPADDENYLAEPGKYFMKSMINEGYPWRDRDREN